MNIPRRGSSLTRGVLMLLLAALLSPLSAAGQLNYGTPDNPGEIDFDRPESWAMKYYTSVSVLTGLGVPGSVGEGNLVVGVEGGFIPTLSDDQRRVGFNGTKLEDLNKTSLFGRLRVTLGLPSDAELTLAYVPPVELNGVKPNLFAAALGVPLFRSREFRVGARVHGQIGSLKGDFSCDAETVAFGTDPTNNPFGCDAISDDRTTQNYVGIELSAATQTASAVEPYIAVGANRFATEFETNAVTFGTLDNSTFKTSGTTLYGTAGLRFDVSDRVVVGGEVFYSPLSVVRPGDPSAQGDGLLNGRGMLQIRF
ncbi:MAG: hypothetical protein ACR2QM_10055 [Longimicrobiales bacterium]